jgi:ribosomal protein S18 acetylase RimI-like enzyme
MATTVRQLDQDDWEVIRDLRLQALGGDPYAFGSTLQREESFSRRDWREFLRRFAWFVADDGRGDVGVVAGLVGEDVVPGACEVISMWVAPPARGEGTGDALIDAVRGWAHGEGATTLVLRVADGNERARRFYERIGFTSTGRSSPLSRDQSTCAHEYLMAI